MALTLKYLCILALREERTPHETAEVADQLIADVVKTGHRSKKPNAAPARPIAALLRRSLMQIRIPRRSSYREVWAGLPGSESARPRTCRRLPVTVSVIQHRSVPRGHPSHTSETAQCGEPSNSLSVARSLLTPRSANPGRFKWPRPIASEVPPPGGSTRLTPSTPACSLISITVTRLESRRVLAGPFLAGHSLPG